MSGWGNGKPNELIGKLRLFIYIVIPVLAFFLTKRQYDPEYLRPSIFILPVLITRYKIKSEDDRSILLALTDMAFIGYNIYLYHNWSLFSLFLMPMSTVRHLNRSWTMGLIAVTGILCEYIFLWKTDDAMFQLTLHSMFAIIFTVILMTVTSIELREERERIEVSRLLYELRIAHDYLKDNNRNLAYLAQTDALTELYNYRFFETTITSCFENALRYEYPLSLLMVDVDHFKNLNDTFGHRCGDKALKSIALILKESVRKEDLVCRYGGEEFTVILPKTDLNQAKDLAERICTAVRNFEHRGVGMERITVSIGVSAFPEEAKSIQELTEFADQALYEAKRQGRDCVVVRRILCSNISI